MFRIVILLVFSLVSLYTQAAKVDTVVIYSAAMHKPIKCVVIVPDSYKGKKNHYPVVYLLHGHSDDYSGWVTKVPEIKKYADAYQLIIVNPDGGFNSWYFDSPLEAASQYETHISKEVVNFVDTHYRTLADREHRAITGLSMGGHGAFYLALKHPDVFGAIGSMSGAMDLRPFPEKWQIKEKIGDSKSQTDEWNNRSVTTLIEKCPKDKFAIIFDCGVNDFFFTVNQQLHEKMLQLGIPHDYIVRPGKHEWPYWSNAIEYQLLFFRKYFKSPF
jgi:S-formylglutathione hydrolase FrmB